MSIEQKRVEAEDDDIRLDRFFRRYFKNVGHVTLEKALRKGSIRVNGKRVKSSTRLHEGDLIRIPPFQAYPDKFPAKSAVPHIVTDAERKMIQAAVIYKDAQLLVLNKPAGLAVQGGSGITVSVDLLLDALRFDAKERPKLLHRLDKDTSGVLMLARTAKAAGRFAALFKGKGLQKEYLAVVSGVPTEPAGSIDVPIAKSEGKYEKVRSNPKGQHALTHYRVLDEVANMAALVHLMPVTGRTHQLRVHMSVIDTPVAGDGKYGGKDAFIEGIASRLHLHAWKITFPGDKGTDITVKAPLPLHMKKTLSFLGLSVD